MTLPKKSHKGFYILATILIIFSLWQIHLADLRLYAN